MALTCPQKRPRNRKAATFGFCGLQKQQGGAEYTMGMDIYGSSHTGVSGCTGSPDYHAADDLGLHPGDIVE
jgi:hypothetical protein